jgi:hypothetical protein
MSKQSSKSSKSILSPSQAAYSIHSDDQPYYTAEMLKETQP